MTLLDTRQEPIREMRMEPATQNSALIDVIERLVTNPAADVAKLRELIDMQREMLREQARIQFEADFVEMQKELPIIAEKGEIKVNGSIRSKFARHEDITEIVRPILAKWGFSLRHKNEQHDKTMTITAILSHRSGHQATDTFTCSPDNSGGKNDVQAMGSTREYGRRYTTESILNIVTRGQDTDAATPKAPETPAPKGFDNWWTDLQAVADNGHAELKTAFEKSKYEFRQYLIKTNLKGWEELKVKAANISAKAAK